MNPGEAQPIRYKLVMEQRLAPQLGRIIDTTLQSQKETTMKTIPLSDPLYPLTLTTFLGERAPAQLTAIGNTDILDYPKRALFCSSRCPGKLIDMTYDLSQSLRREGRTVVSGFHSPMEKECLSLLIRSPHPIVACPARGLDNMRVPVVWRRALDEGRLLILSGFPGPLRRATASQARQRNRFAAALADEVLIAHARSGSKLERLAADVAAWQKPLYTLPHPANRHLEELGARAIGA
jgi:predicted Rossmann fold nucleotide-binding protein DprA/Smf involved in DNA uptake